VIAAVPRWLLWTVAGLLTVGAGLTSQVLDQEMQPLRKSLPEVVPAQFDGFTAEDVVIPDEELKVAGVTDYLMRTYQAGSSQSAATPWLSVYVGYYESQTQGKTIHSPKNCMPGSGWEAIAARTVDVPVAGGAPVQVNRYLLVNEGQQVLVLYWYQGRGRVVASEYRAKWDLLRDAAIKRRSDEALVRVVVPVIDGDEERAFGLALSAAQRLLPSVAEALPAA
jgi:EpsI family protein